MRMLPEDLAAGPPRIVVAIPAKNEARLLPRCLRALSAQRGVPPFAVVVFANECTDGTAPAARCLAPELTCRLHVIEARLEPAQRPSSNRGPARVCPSRCANDAGRRRCSPTV
jgi:glycosyltransferase involved in cell wall biosynthesis